MVHMKSVENIIDLLEENENLKARLSEYKDIVDAIKNGAVDALAINRDGRHDIFTLESSDIVYRILVENFGEGALNITENGLIVYSNIAFETLLGAPSSSIIGVEINTLIDKESRKKFKQLFTAAFSGKSRGEVSFYYKGRTIPVFVSLSSLYPRFPGIGIIVTDLSEKKQNEALISDYKKKLTDKEDELMTQIINSNTLLEQANKELERKNAELLQSNKELASFSYIASHDLQEPLRKIQTFIGKLQDDGLKLSDKEQDYFKRITSAAIRMQNLINALFNYSRLGSDEYNYSTVHLHDVVEEVKQNLGDIIEEKNVTIKYDRLPAMQMLTSQFTQLFSNLIDNSIKYSRPDESPVITIKAELMKNAKLSEELPPDNYWKITYTDNGIGFAPEYNEKIFELFKRLHGKSEYSGTGIGLAICKKVVENHNGKIKAEGFPGKGACFQIFIPEVQPTIHEL